MRFMQYSTLAAVLMLTACAADDPYMRTKTGAAIGAVAGAVLGHQMDGDDGRYVGAAVGAAIGGGVGYALDRQHQQLQALAAENQNLGIDVQRLQDGSIKLNIPNGVTFDFDSARLKSEFVPTLERVAGIMNQDQRTLITVVGHTDSTGAPQYNLDLSKRRATNVAGFLNSRGIESQRLYTQGRGETQPIADNSTDFGRQQNRRVELYIRPPATS